MIQFAYTILYVRDVAASIRFYEQAFGFQQKFISPENDYGDLISGTTSLAFAALTLGQQNLEDGFQVSDPAHKPFGIELAFATADVAATVAQALEYGATLISEPKVKPWGQTVAYVRDIDGFLIEICTPVQ